MGEQGATHDPARIVVPGRNLAQSLRDALTGPAHLGATEVLWNDRGSKLIMDVGSLQVHTGDGSLVIAVDTRTAEFGTAPLIVRFAFGTPQDATTLVATTDATALGHPLLAARWGGLFRDVVWSAIVRFLVARAADRKLAPTAVQLTPDGLTLQLDQHVVLADLARTHIRTTRETGGGGPA